MIENKYLYFYGLFIIFIYGCATTTSYDNLPTSYNRPSPTIKDYPKKNYYSTEGNFINYRVKKKDTLTTIAHKFNVDIDTIIRINKIRDPHYIEEGDIIKIPIYDKYNDNAESFIWPIDSNSNLSFTNYMRLGKKGVDIIVSQDTFVKSSYKGLVSFAGYIKGYGNTVIIEHPNGFVTIYSNLSSIITKNGSFVKQGEVIAKIENNPSSKTFLHFEIRKGIDSLEPLTYLKQR